MKFKDKQSAIDFLSSLADLMEEHNADIILDSDYEMYWGYAQIQIEGMGDIEIADKFEIVIGGEFTVTRNVIKTETIRKSINRLTTNQESK